jgi:hypothetical protein
MALQPRDAIHAAQIEAGIKGRKGGHTFEDDLTKGINALPKPFVPNPAEEGRVYRGDIAPHLMSVILNHLKLASAEEIAAFSVGSLATAEEGKKWLIVNGIEVRRCKSDLIVTLTSGGQVLTKGVSVKQCNNSCPTNAQLYCTGARGFCEMLVKNGIPVTPKAVEALRMFAGDTGFQPSDSEETMRVRETDPRHYFWEELPDEGKRDLEHIFTAYQDQITRLLLQKAYAGDHFTPDYLLHKTKAVKAGEPLEAAIYSIDELIALSRKFGPFNKVPYHVKKGSYKDPEGVMHEAPRFGIVQFQRLGNQQNPTELQFNLKAGYFYKI